MRATFLALTLAILPVPAMAQIGGAICTAGAGCSCVVADDVGLFPALLGEGVADGPAPDTIVVDRSTNTTFRTRRSLDDVHLSFGGSGDCPNAVTPADIVPRDGTWRWRSLDETTTGCPAMLAAAITRNRQETLASRVTWDGAFHPDRLAENLPQPEIGDMTAYEWRQIGPNRWLSDNIQGRDCSDGTCVDVALTLAMNAVSETRLSGLLHLRSRVDGPQAGILGQFGMG
ncbi:MAG: hypothetical protein P3W94_010845, partial [Paracoccus sp. (in: a-proteobacteria)]|nr:hypothetical protein [Paracoccus sp. (in: a-proteobacteria)]